MINEIQDQEVYDIKTVDLASVYGVVKSSSGPIDRVLIRIKNTFTEVYSNTDEKASVFAAFSNAWSICHMSSVWILGASYNTSKKFDSKDMYENRHSFLHLKCKN